MRLIKRTLGATLGLAALLAAPAHAKDLAAGNCTPAGTMSAAFAPFGDNGLYTPVLDAGLENEADGWTFTGDAAVTDGNEPWFIGGDSADNHALDLPEKATATTAPLCVDETFTHFRLFVRGSGTLRVEVLYTDAKGKVVSEKSGDVKLDASDWAPTGQLPIEVIKKAGMSTVPVAFRFTAKSGDFQLDDVYVDPWARS
jgi:hypothetical protein